MSKNPALQILIFGVVVMVGLFPLFSPGEAQSTAVICLEWFAVIGSSLGVLGAVYSLASGKQRGAGEKRP